MAASMSASVGRGLSLSSAAAAISMPLWQNPHCGTSSASQAFCSGCDALGARPSMVVIFCVGATAEAGITQLRTATPSRCTVQAPHWATPQPYFVPVRLSCSRSTQSNGVSGSASNCTRLPLTVNSAMPAAPFAPPGWRARASLAASAEPCHAWRHQGPRAGAAAASRACGLRDAADHAGLGQRHAGLVGGASSAWLAGAPCEGIQQRLQEREHLPRFDAPRTAAANPGRHLCPNVADVAAQGPRRAKPHARNTSDVSVC